MDEKLKEKITKIMALAEKAGTEGEAAAAMEKLRFLLAKHNIDMAELQEDAAEPSVTEKETSAEAWSRVIYRGVAQLYFCQIYLVAYGNKTTVRVLGEKDNVAVAMRTAKTLVKICKRLAGEHERAARDAIGAARSFKLGFAHRILGRCEEMIAQAKKGAIPNGERGCEGALVLADAYAAHEERNLAYLKKLNVARTVPRAHTVRPSSYKAGGEKAEIERLGREALA